jgi:hypothetical protein
MADAAQVRKRVRTEIDHARRSAAERRERASAANRAFETFLSEVAVPAFRTLTQVLRAEGIHFELQTPSGGVRLVADRQRDDAISLELDDSVDPPQPMLVTTRIRGSRVLRTERAVKERIAIDKITEDDLIERLIEEIRPWFG